MNNIKEKLPNISLLNIRNLESSIVSIYKLNKEHRFFISILEQNPEIDCAEYIIYPNINGQMDKIFLDKYGSEILIYEDSVSEFILIPCDFEELKKSIMIDNPYINSLKF